MITQQLVPPEQIESKLAHIWELSAKENKLRACLFNLIVFTHLSDRTDYLRGIVQKVVDTYPCRVLFITHDNGPSKNYLKTAVSIATPEGDSLIVCDQIDIGVAGSDWERVPSVILPHIVPDLPVYLLWAENLTQRHPLFDQIAPYATRIIFDSESAEDLLHFAETLLNLNEQQGRTVADLNWGRLEGWRDCISTLFREPEYEADLTDIERINIVYNARASDIFTHLKIQSIYLLTFFAARLNWTFQSNKTEGNTQHFAFKRINAAIEPALWQNLGPGAVISLELFTRTKKHYLFSRNPKSPHTATIHITTPEHCELPYQIQFGKTFSGQSLVREIFYKGTSPFLLEILHKLLSYQTLSGSAP